MTQATEPFLMAQALHVVIWDQPGKPPTTDCTTIYWNEFFSPAHLQNKISLPQYVEDSSDNLKQRFLTFVREVGESQIADKSTIEHLRILPEFSYWWMTLFTCKRWSTTSNIIEAIRLLALEDILREMKPTKVSFATERHAVKHVMQDWCVRSGIEFQFLTASNSESSHRFQLSRLIPRPIGAISVLVREIIRRLRAPKNMTSIDNPADVVFIDYLTRFDVDCALQGQYRSGFWNILTDSLDDAKQTSLFFHQFVANSVTPNRKTTTRFLEGLNSRSTTQQHFLLDARLSVGIVLKTLFIYFRLLKTRFQIRDIKHSFSPSASQLDLWKLFKKEWLDSLSGSTAILHSLTIGELENTILNIPPCRKVLYLMENQPWEMAFIQLWKHHRSEPLIGVPHSSIRYWDLRYFLDPNAYYPGSSAHHPLPNTVAVNGPAALKSLNAAGIPAEQLIEVEALAYSYLEDVQSVVSAQEISNATMRLLVLGDFFDYQNVALLSMLQSSLVLTQRQILVTVKPHPLCPIDHRDFPHLQFHIDTRPLAEQLSECDMVLATNGTSASAEAYQCGLPVITVLNGETFNFSPLRDIHDALFVDSPTHLTQALGQVVHQDQTQRFDYFLIDKSLQRWKYLLSI
ncbi:MAG: TIGR04326 family surface carbohydrate biosynthesis protein [Ilumatobacteraceae bacterium]